MVSHSQNQTLHSDNINFASDNDNEDGVNEVEHEECEVGTETEITENQSKRVRKNTSKV